MSELTLTTPEELDRLLQQHPGVLLYFTTPGCNVCKVLRPKLFDLFQHHYPEMVRAVVDLEQSPAFSGHYSVFAVPTVLLFLDGREFVRKSRSFSPAELVREIERPWSYLSE